MTLGCQTVSKDTAAKGHFFFALSVRKDDFFIYAGAVLRYTIPSMKKEGNKMVLENGRPRDLQGRLEKEIRVYDLLDSLGISYQRIDHEAAMTMEAC